MLYHITFQHNEDLFDTSYTFKRNILKIFCQIFERTLKKYLRENIHEYFKGRLRNI